MIEKSADSNVAVNSSGFIKKCPKVLDNLDLPKKYDSFYIKPKDKYKEYELLSSSFVYVDEETGELFAKTKKENRIIGARK